MWSPAAAGRGFDLAPTSLKPLEPYREHVTIVSNTMDHAAEAWAAPEVGGDHFRSSATFLTQVHPKQTEGSDIHAGMSVDRIYATEYGQDSAIPSLQLCIEPVDQAGGCDYGYACVYTDTISVGVADRAAAGLPRPAGRVQPALRLGRHADGPCLAAGGQREHPRLAHRANRRRQAAARSRRPAAVRPVPRRRAGDRAAHPERRGPATAAESRGTSRKRPSVCPTRSTSTCT